jgi:hypothetical protein
MLLRRRKSYQNGMFGDLSQRSLLQTQVQLNTKSANNHCINACVLEDQTLAKEKCVIPVKLLGRYPAI